MLSCGNETTPSDYSALTSFLANETLEVASQLSFDHPIPLHIIFVNLDDGTPPSGSSGFAFNEGLSIVNQYFDGLFEFYVCGYHHINSTELSNFDISPDKVNLYNAYHVDYAINVYLVTSAIRTGLAAFPNDPSVNNAIWLVAGGISEDLLAHELGHYFGLLHTHVGLYFGPTMGNCFLKDPLTEDTDGIPDTPVDPGPVLLCSVPECPIALTSCTLSCDQSNGNVTYTYEGYHTDNIMSYHNCNTKRFTEGQKDAMLTIFMHHPNRVFLADPTPICNNEIAEYGHVIQYCELSGGGSPVKDIRVNLKNETTGWTYSQKTEGDGSFAVYPGKFSNLVQVTVKPLTSHPNIGNIFNDPTSIPTNYNPIEGVSTQDIIDIGKHILSMEMLEPPYEYIAADVNLSGSITTFDMALIRRVILGIDPDFPMGTWHFVPEHYLDDNNFKQAFEIMPFWANYFGLPYPHYLDRVALNMYDDAVSNTESWSFRGVKMGDVNCEFMPEEEFTSSESDDRNLFVSYNTPSNNDCIANGDIFAITMSANAGQPLLGYQLGLKYDQDKLQYIGNEAGDLPDFNADNFAELNGNIRTLWYRNDFEAETFSSTKSLFKLHFKSLDEFCNLEPYFMVDNNVLKCEFYGESSQIISPSLLIDYHPISPTGTLLSPFPNPVSNSVTFSFQLNDPCVVEIRLSDYLGGMLHSSQIYSSGLQTNTFNDLSGLSNGPVNYMVKMGASVFSGILIKTQP